MRSIVLGSLLFLFLPTGNLIAAVSPLIDYLYIDSGEGSSSGGHAAIRFGEDVFHFQYFEPGVLRSVKDNLRYFRYIYGSLGNRTIQASRIAVSEETWTLLHDHFNQRYLIQNQQYAILDALEKDQALIRILLQRKSDSRRLSRSAVDDSISLPAAGLFFSDHRSKSKSTDAYRTPLVSEASRSSSVLRTLRKRVEQHYGSDFIAARVQTIRKSLRQMKPTEYDQSLLTLSEDRYPPTIYPFSQRYKDQMTAMMGLQALQKGLPLRHEVYVAPRYDLFRLGAGDHEPLVRFKQQLENDLVRLVGSRRPDWGVALLVGMARLIVVEQSLRSGRLVFLDTFQANDDLIDLEVIEENSDLMLDQLNAVKAQFQQARAELPVPKVMTEIDYSHLEHWGNRYLEIRQGIEQNRPIRIHSGHLLPTRAALRFDLVVPEVSEATLRRSLADAERFQYRYADRLKQLYRYNLITKNCASEIFRTIHGAFDAYLASKESNGEYGGAAVASRKGRIEAESIERLGGYIETEGAHIIPFISSHRVNQNYRTIASEEWLSYRKEKLTKAYRESEPLLIYLRESNVISATLYRQNPDDSFFVFFTDDTILPRPIFGIINSVAGLGQSIVGLFTAPFDGGQLLNSGSRGVLFSLPELLFFNIRKGSYRYLPYEVIADEG